MTSEAKSTKIFAAVFSISIILMIILKISNNLQINNLGLGLFLTASISFVALLLNRKKNEQV